jgi:hypothetical protein
MTDYNRQLQANLETIALRSRIDKAKYWLTAAQAELVSRSEKIRALKDQVKAWEKWRRSMMIYLMIAVPVIIIASGMVGYAFGARFG